MFAHINRILLALSLSLMLCVPQVMAATESTTVVKEDPGAVTMAADAALARPALFVATILGSALWLVTLPFSLAGGNAKKAGEKLVVEPAMGTFVRCLGCKYPGYQKTVKSEDDDEEVDAEPKAEKTDAVKEADNAEK